MMQSFYEIFDKVVTAIGPINIFYSGLILILGASVIVTVISAVKTGYSLGKRLWFFAFIIAVLAIEYCVYSRVGQDLTALYLTCGVSLLLSVPVLAVPTRSVKVDREQREFARFLDAQISKRVVAEPYVNVEHLHAQKQQPKQNHNALDLQLDFNHVKNVIERLNYYGLSQSDKKTIEELSRAIDSAENGDCTNQNRETINDGLGGLLKIMSKYGV